MKRRQFLSVGAVAGVSSVALGAGCGGALVESESLFVPGDLDATLARWDAGLQTISEASLVSGFAESLGAVPSDAAADLDRLARKSLTALYSTSVFAELPAEAQSHPEVQQRMWLVAPAANEALLETNARLRDLGAADHERMRLRLSEDPDLIMRFCAYLDDEASTHGISPRARKQTRAILTHVSSRLRRQPPTLLIDEYLGKVEKVYARHPVDALVEQQCEAQVAAARLWATQPGAPAIASAWAVAGPQIMPQAAASNAVQGGRQLSMEAARERAGDALLSAGLVLMGMAVLIGVISVAVGDIVGLFGATLGGVLLLAGLVVLAVSGAY